MTPAEVLEVREDPRVWFQGFGYWLHPETREPTRGRAKVLQRRYFEHYRRCQAAGKPCRMVGLKYRRAASSTAGTALLYVHANNYKARLGVIGTDYKASSNMLEMIETFGTHDQFPWSPSAIADGGQAFTVTGFETVAWEERIEKRIATKIVWPHGSRVELYTAENPESARSAGLSGYLATECGRWPKDGVKEGGKTLVAMRNTLPKKGFHVAIEESTAEGAAGAFYETCLQARWPDYDDYWKQWESDWPLTVDPIGADLQFVFIFAAWFEDDEAFVRLTPEEQAHIEATLDAEPSDAAQPSWDGEKELIARYQQDGPRGPRLGGEVDATVWEQLAWRRMIIKQTGGLANFKTEYPSNPLEAFRASGAPVFNPEGLAAIEKAQRTVSAARKGVPGVIDKQPNGGVWRRTREAESVFTMWEAPAQGSKYIVIVDPMSGCEIVAGSNTRDRHSVLVLRDAYKDQDRTIYPVKLVARVKAPCQWDNTPLARQIINLSEMYGRAPVVVESNMGIALLEKLIAANVNLYAQQDFIAAEQKTMQRIGWRNDEPSRRLAISTGQEYIREQKLEILCPHVLNELKTFVFDRRGHAAGASGHHDDDVLALCIGLTCMAAAMVYQHPGLEYAGPADASRWKTTT